MRVLTFVTFWIVSASVSWAEDNVAASMDAARSLNQMVRDAYYLDDDARSSMRDLARPLTERERRSIYETYSLYGPDGIFAKARLNPFPRYWSTPRRWIYWTTGAALIGLGGTADYFSASHDGGESKIVSPWLFGTAVGLLLGSITYLFWEGAIINRIEDNQMREGLLLGEQQDWGGTS